MYTIKWLQELGWAALVAALGVIYTTISGLGVDELLADPGALIALLAVAVGRVVGALVLNAVVKAFGSTSA